MLGILNILKAEKISSEIHGEVYVPCSRYKLSTT